MRPPAAAVRTRLAEKRSPSYLQDFIYGAIDGTVTTFAVVAGVDGANLDEAIVVTANRERWIETMMTEQLGLSPTGRSELHAAFATFCAFVTVGFLPLLVFVYELATPGEVGHTFTWSAVMTAAAFVVVGAVKARFVDQRWWRSALETLAVGGTAAALAYAAGALLQQLL